MELKQSKDRSGSHLLEDQAEDTDMLEGQIDENGETIHGNSPIKGEMTSPIKLVKIVKRSKKFEPKEY